MAKKKKLVDRNGQTIYPQTAAECVVTAAGDTLQELVEVLPVTFASAGQMQQVSLVAQTASIDATNALDVAGQNSSEIERMQKTIDALRSMMLTLHTPREVLEKFGKDAVAALYPDVISICVPDNALFYFGSKKKDGTLHWYPIRPADGILRQSDLNGARYLSEEAGYVEHVYWPLMYDFERIDYLNCDGFAEFYIGGSGEGVFKPDGVTASPAFEFEKEYVDNFVNLNFTWGPYKCTSYDRANLPEIRGEWYMPNTEYLAEAFVNYSPGVFGNTRPLVRLPDKIIAPKVVDVRHLFNGPRYASQFPEIDFANVADAGWYHYVCGGLDYMGDGPVHMRIRNLGQQKTYWGARVDICARGSEWDHDDMIYSLLDNSFDRKAAGYPTLTINLTPESLALLSDEEKAAITAKGYTLVEFTGTSLGGI